MPKRAKRQRPASREPDVGDGSYDYPGPDEVNDPSDNFEDFSTLYYGTKGIGKTTLTSSIPNSLTLMFEPRRKNLRIRQLALAVHSAKQIMDGAEDVYERVKITTQRLIDDDSVHNLNMDSIDLLYEACRNSISAANGVVNPSKAGKGSSTIWIEIADEFRSYLDTLAETGMGITYVSHAKTREIETVDGMAMEMQSPSCAPACLQYLKQACDFAFFYGYYNNQRAMCVRDPTNTVWTACGVEGRFLQPDGKPLKVFEMPEDDPKKSYSQILRAFNNELWDIDTPEEERVTSRPAKKRPAKKKVRR